MKQQEASAAISLPTAEESDPAKLLLQAAGLLPDKSYAHRLHYFINRKFPDTREASIAQKVIDSYESELSGPFRNHAQLLRDSVEDLAWAMRDTAEFARTERPEIAPEQAGGDAAHTARLQPRSILSGFPFFRK